jgi:3-oxoacyl-[acyl-carrier protein] reductase
MEWNGELADALLLEGKVAVVTGAGSGLGREITRVLALAGARVALVDVNEEGLRGTLDLIGAPSTISYRADISDREAVEALADRVLSDSGRLDVWVNCAALGYIHPILETDPVKAERVVAVNMMGSYWGCAAAARVMRDHGGGSIVNISSGGGDHPAPATAIYGMTKAAVNSLTWSAAADFGRYGIRVNSVSPGWFETPMSSSMYRNAAGEVDLAMREAVIAAMKQGARSPSSASRPTSRMPCSIWLRTRAASSPARSSE